ncbi:MAG: NADP-dependent oxidoreductase [Halioglobus sp.]|nr:NADP-dependent oxidoreductase [Halioglobus sp.]
MSENGAGQNQHILLAARPSGAIKATDFEIVDAPMPTPGAGEILIKADFLAVEPAMRGWMEDRASYVPPVRIGEVMRGQGTGTVEASNHPDFPVGTAVTGMLGWRRYIATDGKSVSLRKLPEGVSPAVALNVLGLTGLTAYFGMLDLGKPETGNTVLVSGAAGATGSVAGQLARIAGARVVGIAGGSEKCAWLVDELGFEAAIDYKREDTAQRVADLCPQGVDIYYDNVGGDILDIALDNLALHARVVLCGGISRYNATGPLAGPANYFNLVYKRARMEGFILIDYAPRFAAATKVLVEHLNTGALRHRETILEGFDQLPKALMHLFSGLNIGKQLVDITR